MKGHDLLLDVSRLVWRSWENKLPTGIDRTCLAYVRHFGTRARAVIQRGGLTLIMSANVSRRLFELLIAPRGATRRQLTRLTTEGIFSHQSHELAGRIYLNVGHTGLDKPGHAAWVGRTGIRPVYFLHDLIPLTHPEYCRPGEPNKHLERMRVLLSLGQGVIGNSQETLAELARFANTHRDSVVPLSLVAPLGITPAGQDAAMPRIATPYFVTVGTIEGRKNHLLLLNLWAEMARSLGPLCPLLVIIGQRGWECEQAIDMIERCAAIQGHVVELPRCSDAELAAYMRGARALLFPSFVEGYGLPLVEALACGTPVIASDLGVFRELAGDIPDYLSPLDGLGWRDRILDYAEPDSPTRAAQFARMEGWSPPTWDAHFKLVDRWLAQMPR